MNPPEDVWRALTRMALRLINDLDVERTPMPASSIAEAAISAFRDVRGIERYRERLEAFVGDVLDDSSTAPHA